MIDRVLRLGTRRSALARAQSGLMARALERAHPGLRVELVGIDTRGDRILDQPLSQVEGKEFFTAELDRALAAGEVDCTVHSCKDLSLERPAALALAAVPARENPRDIALFAADAPARLAAGEALRIGSSSPRRVAFMPEFLRPALPGGAARIELVELRGNVDSRLRRLREPRGSARQLDGVILALAGLARLWQDETGRALLGELLAGLPRMVVPLTACPAAPAQGALAIECRTADAATRALLAVLDHAPTRAAVAAERAILAARGGGCHQRLGATQVAVPGLGALLHLRETQADGSVAASVRWQPEQPLPPRGSVLAVWDGTQAEGGAGMEPLPEAGAQCAAALAAHRAVFISHRRALPELMPDASANLSPRLQATAASIWVPGLETWHALARRGLWVQGCAEGLGFETLRALLAEPVLQLPPLREWLVLTHADAVAGWQSPEGPRVLATYRHATPPGGAARAAGAAGGRDAGPSGASHIYWHSAAQFQHWSQGGRTQFAAGAQHACGFGKTAARLRAAGLSGVTVFPSVREWRDWLAA